MEKAQQKYIDVLTLAISLNLKHNLILDPTNIVQPASYHSRTGHRLPKDMDQLQTELTNLSQYAEDYQMKINTKKTQLMLFNTSNTQDFVPELEINNCFIDTAEEIKPLGIRVTNDGK